LTASAIVPLLVIRPNVMMRSAQHVDAEHLEGEHPPGFGHGTGVDTRTFM
jgi:hypothetical protein